MPTDPTTLHGCTLGSLTVEELEACPDGTTLRWQGCDEATVVKLDGAWWGAPSRDAFAIKSDLGDAHVLYLPANPVPPSPTDTSEAPPKPPVYAIGRFVVLPCGDEGQQPFDAHRIVDAESTREGGSCIYYRAQDGSVTMLRVDAPMDALLHAIAKAEGRE